MIAAPPVKKAPLLVGKDDLDLHSNQKKAEPFIEVIQYFH
ncbi:hypothetical protein PMIT1313_01483 [Prochlorococcus marinus str. MIT 1313]|nr:hypothetical protein PMIT1313_01483 [Prochlorococcus marinus str. MIT 1313]